MFYSKSNDFPFNAEFGPLSADRIKKKMRHKDERGYYGTVAVSYSFGTPDKGHFFDLGMGEKTPPKGYGYTEETIRKWIAEDRLVVKRGHVPKLKSYLHESSGVKVGDVWTDIRVLGPTDGERVDYPTQKPIELYQRIIKASSNEGDLVIDPFAGSGTTLIAAKRTGRRFAGCDANPDAVALGNRRLAEMGEMLL